MNKTLFTQWHEEGLLAETSLQKVKEAEAHKLFSLHWEIKTLLYLAVLLLSGGLGILVYKMDVASPQYPSVYSTNGRIQCKIPSYTITYSTSHPPFATFIFFLNLLLHSLTSLPLPTQTTTNP